MKAKLEKKLAAQQMRREGMSLNVISQALHVAKSSVSNWVRGVGLTDDQAKLLLENNLAATKKSRLRVAEINKQRAIDRRLGYQELGRQDAERNDPLHLAGCMLYWAEGTKYRNAVTFSNTDPHMHRFFVRFLQTCFGVTNQQFTISCIIHENDAQQREEIELFWLSELALPANCLRKTTIKKNGKTVTRRAQYGVCRVTVCSTEIVQRIYGAIQQYGGFKNLSWI